MSTMCRQTNNFAIYGMLQNHLCLNIKTYYPDISPGEIVIRGNKKPKLNKLSFRFDFEVISKGNKFGKRGLVIKIPRYPDMQKISVAMSDYTLKKGAKKEFQALCQLFNYFSSLKDNSLGAIRPLDYIEDLNGIVTEAVSGKNLDKEINKISIKIISNKFKKEYLCQHLECCGRWLRSLHHMPYDETQIVPFDPKEDLQIVKNILSKLHEYKIKTSFLHFINDFMQREFNEISSQFDKKDAVLLHRDFQARNILVTDGKIVPFDTDLDKKGLKDRDIAKFICSLRITKSRLLFDRTLFDHVLVRKFENIFLSSYFGNNTYSQKILNWYMLWATLQKWNQFYKIIHLQKGLPYNVFFRLWVNRIFEDEIVQMLK